MIGVVSFNNSAYAYNNTLTKATGSHIKRILSYIDKITASGTVFIIFFNIIEDKFCLSS